MKKTVILIVIFSFVFLAIGCGGPLPDATFKVTYLCSVQESYGYPPIDDTKYLNGTEATVLGPHTLVLAGHKFDGWNTRANGTGTHYEEGETLVVNRNIFLYAMWELE